jgi:hypothetical protein
LAPGVKGVIYMYVVLKSRNIAIVSNKNISKCVVIDLSNRIAPQKFYEENRFWDSDLFVNNVLLLRLF